MYNPYHHHHPNQQRQQPKLPSLHHLMLPSPPLNYHSKMLPQPPSHQQSQPPPTHACAMNTAAATSNHYSLMPPKAPRMESYEYGAPLSSIPSDYQVLNDASLLLFGTSHSNTIPYQSSTSISTPSSLSIPSASSSPSSLSAAPFEDFRKTDI
ncbi:hypothetical protein MBANPS3_007716 [Mucor bainieri]